MEELIKIILDKKYTLETLLLCTPFENDSDRNLLGYFKPSLFFSNDFYAEPCIHIHINQISNEINDKMKNNGNFRGITEINVLKETKAELEKKLDIIEEFNSVIETCMYSEDISYIRSFPGSGKTTYLHKLLFDFRNSHDSVIIDFKSFIPYLTLSGKACNKIFRNKNVNMQNTLVKFIFLLINEINSLLSKRKFNEKESSSTYKEYLKKIETNFNIIFNEREEETDIIELFKPFVENIAQYTREDICYNEFINNVIKYLQQSFVEENSKNIDFLLKFIVVIKLCNLDENVFKSGNYKFIFAFDNLEYFICQDTIYDEDILLIEEILHDFLKTIETFLQNGRAITTHKSNIFIGHFKFIMLIRDSTNFLKGPRQNDDKIKQILDITDTYSITEIHSKRYNAFTNLGVLSKVDAEIYDTIQKILSDISPYRNSSGVSIEEMFNHNKRRMTSYLYDVLKDNENRKECRLLINQIDLQQKELEDKVSDKEKRELKEKNDIWKNALRNYILRLLMDNIQRTKYFSDLQAIGKNAEDLGNGYARKILTYLYLKYLENPNEYVGFYSMMHTVFDKPSTKIEDCNISKVLLETIATIIIKLNEPEKESTKWCQLILVRFEHKKLTKEILIKELQHSYNQKSDESDKYGFKITEAGRYYLTLLPRFEYFACRYISGTKPLYSYENIKCNSERNISEKSFACYNIIEKVKSKTIGGIYKGNLQNGCVQEIFNRDTEFFSNTKGCNFEEMYSGDYMYKLHNNTYGISQIKNIIVNHIGYLDRFRGYVLYFNETENSSEYINKSQKKILSKYLLRVIQEYIDKLHEYAQKKDDRGKFYIDHYNRKNGKRSVETLIQKLNQNVIIETKKLDIKDDYSFNSIFEDNDEYFN